MFVGRVVVWQVVFTVGFAYTCGSGATMCRFYFAYFDVDCNIAYEGEGSFAINIAGRNSVVFGQRVFIYVATSGFAGHLMVIFSYGRLQFTGQFGRRCLCRIFFTRFLFSFRVRPTSCLCLGTGGHWRLFLSRRNYRQFRC